MSTFPLDQLPYVNILHILGKMAFPEASKMRQTCRRIDDLVAKSKDLRFPVSDQIELSFSIITNRAREISLKYFYDVRRRSTTVVEPRNIEFALFDTITVNDSGPLVRPIPRNRDFLPFFKEAKIKCRLFKFCHVEFESDDLFMFIENIKPKQLLYEERAGIFEPPSFNTVRRLVAGCQNIHIQLCDGIPNDYAQALSQYESVRIDSVLNAEMPSLASLIQLLLTDLNIPLKHFHLPVYHEDMFLFKNEIEDLDLGQWQFNRGGDPENRQLGFIVDIPGHFVTLIEHREEDKHYCIGRRTAKADVDALTDQWFDDFIWASGVRYNRVALYKDILENRDNYEALRNRLETALSSSSDFYGLLQ